MTLRPRRPISLGRCIFATEALDSILLREYAQLPAPLQDLYRTVAALEAAGARIHRQLVIRLLNIQADTLKGFLIILEGLVDEYDIKPEDGIYGWRTRHEVIARTLTRYKFADQEEFLRLLGEAITACNPAIYLERRTLNDLCNSSFGIARVASAAGRIGLYERIIEMAPGERVPRHRLVKELIREDRFDQAEYDLRDAIEAVGVDSPLQRYKVLLQIERALRSDGLLKEDRAALLAEARTQALEGIRRFGDDKYSYLVFGRLASAHFAVTGSEQLYTEAAEMIRQGLERTSDPDLARELRRIEQRTFVSALEDGD